MPGGRPRVYVKRTYAEYPAPTEVPGTGICRLWQGAIDRDGYGVLSDPHPTRGNSGRSDKAYPHRKVRAHRWVYEAVHGPIPPGLVVRHKCDNRLCFKLEHLELGSVAENNADTAKRGHAGPVLSFAPSELEMIVELKSLGWTYERIKNERLPDRALSSIKRVGKVAAQNKAEGRDLWESPPPPPDPGAKYASWRERKPS
jgi:HNH endonuclease